MNLAYKLHQPIADMSQDTYHGITGTYSSTQLKDLCDDEAVFIAKYINKTVEKEELPAFSVGSYFHTGVLEPHKLHDDCVVYNGKVRRGREWDSFQAKHSGKTIVSKSQKDSADGLIKLVQDSPVAMKYISRGKPEISLFNEVILSDFGVWSKKYKKILTANGWRDGVLPERKNDVAVVLKVRADCLGDDFVLDLKSTTGNARSTQSMQAKISYYQYDLSAALYLDMFSLNRAEPITDFLWTFASKDFYNCKTYVASEKNIMVGRAKYKKALLRLKHLSMSKWQISDELGVLEPSIFELEHLKDNRTNYL